MSDKINIHTFIDETAELVKVEMDNLIIDESLGTMRDAMLYATDSGGKRLRPAMTRMISMNFGHDNKDVIEVSATCEILHSASLMLDDIQDVDRLRRGQLSTHEMFNVASTSMGAGKLMFLALKLGRKKAVGMMDLLLEAILKLMEGQGMEAGMSTYNKAKYMKMIELKTATLYRAAAEVGAIVAKASTEDKEHVSEFATQFGIAYQILDDWTDVQKSVLYEEPHGDLLTFKITLPMILLFHQYPDTHEVLTRYIGKIEGSDKELVELFLSDEKYRKCIEDTKMVANGHIVLALASATLISKKDDMYFGMFDDYCKFAMDKLAKDV